MDGLNNALNSCNRRLLHQQEVKDIVQGADETLSEALPKDSTVFRIYERMRQEENRWWKVPGPDSTYCGKDDCKHIEYWIQVVDEVLKEHKRIIEINDENVLKADSVNSSNFDPWGPIEGFLFELASDSVQNAISRVGLSLNWQLTKAQSYSHKTRNRVYRQRLAEAYANLMIDEKKKLATNIAKELVEIDEAYKDRINKTLQNIGWVFREEHLLPSDQSNQSIVVESQEEISELQKIFIIHGHDEGLLREVQLFISRAGLDDVVLHEKADKGRTIIDKLIEESQDAAYVIALLSPDDELSDGTQRARQNVILEIGYFLGKLGKSKVRLLKKGRN